MHCPQCGYDNQTEARYCVRCGAALAGAATLARDLPPLPGPAAAATPEFGTFWQRFAAFLIDSMILFMAGAMVGFGVAMAAFVAMMLAGIDPGSNAANIAVQCVGGLIGVVINCLYYSLLESSRYQATLGKLALGLQVTDLAGGRIGFGRAMGRYLGKIISGAILMIGYLMVAFTEKKQGLHDIIAGTLVVRRPRP